MHCTLLAELGVGREGAEGVLGGAAVVLDEQGSESATQKPQVVDGCMRPAVHV